MLLALRTLLPGGLKLYALAGVLVLLASVFVWHKWAVRSAYNAGIESERARARIEAVKRNAETERNNEKFKNLSDRDRCVVFMRDSGLPEHHCNER